MWVFLVSLTKEYRAMTKERNLNIYRITVREISSIEYSVEAGSKEEARDLIGMGDQQIAQAHVVDWDILEIKEYKS